MVEAHSLENDARNNFQFIHVHDHTYKIYSPTCKKYLFVSKNLCNGENLVQAHSLEEHAGNTFNIQLPDEKEYFLSNLKYDLFAAQTTQNPPLNTGTMLFKNDTGVEKNCSHSVTVSYAQSKNWNTNLDLKVGVKTTFQGPIPLIKHAKTKLSSQRNGEYAWGGSFSTTKTLEETVGTKVKPRSKVNCNYSIVQNQITVPYSGTLTIDYGTFKMDWPINGSYVGVGKTHMVVHYDNLYL